MPLTDTLDTSKFLVQKLLRLKQLDKAYALDEKLSPLVREISWTDLLHRIALIEKAGTGIRRMIEDAMKHKCPEPKFTVNGFFTATFWPNIEIVRKITGQVTEQVGEEVSEQVGTKLALSRHQVEILHNCLQEKSLLGIMSQVGRKDRTKFRTKFIKPLVESGLLEMTIPDKPQSSKQRYRTTDLGRKVLDQKNG